MENNLIYALYCPIHNKPVYVGQSSVGMKRPFEHIKEKSHSIKVHGWIKDLRQQGLEPILVILEHNFEDKYLNDKEQFWINKHLNQGCLLFNQNGVSPAFYQSTEFDIINADFLFEIRMFIKGRRKVLKMTQRELAEKAGVGIRFLRELEQGTKSNFNTASIEKVLMLMGNVRLSVVRVL
jgi:hypothetical protein